MRLLIVEDETELACALKKGLESLGFAVDLTYNGIEGEESALTSDYDVIILDLNLPGRDGIEVCRNLRKSGCISAVLMLTARGQISDRTMGLDSGADDYLVKPFAFDELRARVQALLRRSYGSRNPVITIGKLSIEPASRTVSYGGESIELTAKEFDILEYVARRYPEVVSTEDILEHTWNDQIDPFSNVVRVHLANLRRKLKDKAGEAVIETVIGKGYKLCER